MQVEILKYGKRNEMLVLTGLPKDFAFNYESYTAKYLKDKLT
jgi:hypothetical protein